MQRSPITDSARPTRWRSCRRAPASLRALAGCLSLHIARADDVTQRKLFAPSSPLFFVPQLNFMPSVGLYFVARQPQAGQETFRVYKLPTTPPKDPFEVRAATTCTDRSAKPRDASAGRACRATSPAARNPRVGRSRRMPPRRARGTSSTRAIRLSSRRSLLCGRVAATTADELAQRGFGGATVPELNYAPASAST